MSIKIIARGKKHLSNYKIIEKMVVGIVLTGDEIKSLRNYQSSISEAYVLFQQGEPYIVNMHITSYKYSYSYTGISTGTGASKRKRKLLLQRQEINRLTKQVKTKNYLLIPLLLFINEKGWAKLEIALSQHLRKYQIKNLVKEREVKKKLKEKNWW